MPYKIRYEGPTDFKDDGAFIFASLDVLHGYVPSETFFSGLISKHFDISAHDGTKLVTAKYFYESDILKHRYPLASRIFLLDDLKRETRMSQFITGTITGLRFTEDETGVELKLWHRFKGIDVNDSRGGTAEVTIPFSEFVRFDSTILTSCRPGPNYFFEPSALPKDLTFKVKAN